MPETNKDQGWAERLDFDLEHECEAWDWVRAAGVSLQELRIAVLESMTYAKAA